jgi:hypothetical protein
MATKTVEVPGKVKKKKNIPSKKFLKAGLSTVLTCSIAEPEPVEPQHFPGAGAENFWAGSR